MGVKQSDSFWLMNEILFPLIELSKVAKRRKHKFPEVYSAIAKADEVAYEAFFSLIGEEPKRKSKARSSV